MNCPHLWAVDSSWIELGDGGISTVPLLFPLYFPVAQKMQQGEDKDHRPLTDVYFTRGLWTDSKIKGLSLSSSTLTTQRGLHSFFSLSLSTSDMFWPQMYHVRWQPRGVQSFFFSTKPIRLKKMRCLFECVLWQRSMHCCLSTGATPQFSPLTFVRSYYFCLHRGRCLQEPNIVDASKRGECSLRHERGRGEKEGAI